VNGLICDGARGPRLNALDLTVSTMHAEAMQSSASRHLKQLESESIYILREAVAEFPLAGHALFHRQGFLVLLHLAMKAFYPAKPPFP
jgi:3'-phosphoadenosine 5'-phosphosulfate sulfotransferase (PAPS reductase)/FAD synthetase